LFTFDRAEWCVKEAAYELGLPKSTTSELLADLARSGLLERVGRGRYRLGWSVFSLAQVLVSSARFVTIARHVMEELVALWNETCHLAVLCDGEVLYVEKIRSDRALDIILTRVGGRLWVHCSGVGKVLLAARPWDEVSEIVSRRGLPALTPNTITDLGALRRELEAVRRLGYAYDQEEAMIGLCCAAAPIYDESGQVVAAMSLSVPAYRFYPNRQRLTTAIVDAARRVSEELGYYQEGWPWRNGKRSRSRSSVPGISVLT
jgi:DNA-binding IclR family transcriptional regulator